MKKFIFCMLKVTEDFGADPDPHPDPLVRGTDPDPYQNVTDPENCLRKKGGKNLWLPRNVLLFRRKRECSLSCRCPRPSAGPCWCPGQKWISRSEKSTNNFVKNLNNERWLRWFVSKPKKKTCRIQKTPIRGKQNWTKTTLMIKKGKYRRNVRKVLEG
jgi:hypothetical protein